VDSKITDVRRKEVRSAAAILTAAFEGDAVFEYCFGSAEEYRRLAPGTFAGYIRWARLYGRAWTSQDANVVALRLPPGGRRFTTWNTLRSGMMISFLMLELSAQKRFEYLGELVAQARQRVMGEVPHWYCWMIGVSPRQQRSGIGGRMMRHTFAEAAKTRTPCYLETFSESNVKLHSKQGYEVRDTVKFDGTPLTLYAMVRDVR